MELRADTSLEEGKDRKRSLWVAPGEGKVSVLGDQEHSGASGACPALQAAQRACAAGGSFFSRHPWVLLLICSCVIDFSEGVFEAEPESGQSKQCVCTLLGWLCRGAAVGMRLRHLVAKKRPRTAAAVPGLPSEDVCHCLPPQHSCFQHLSWIACSERHLPVELKCT